MKARPSARHIVLKGFIRENDELGCTYETNEILMGFRVPINSSIHNFRPETEQSAMGVTKDSTRKTETDS